MFQVLWKALPGPVWLRAIQIVSICVAVLVVLFLVVFPFIVEVFFQEPSTVS